MTIALTSEQKRWLEAAVADGRFASIEEALEAALVGLMTADEPADDTIKPLLDEARQAAANGDSISLEDFKVSAAQRWHRPK